MTYHVCWKEKGRTHYTEGGMTAEQAQLVAALMQNQGLDAWYEPDSY